MKRVLHTAIDSILVLIICMTALSMCDRDARSEPLAVGYHSALSHQAARMVWRSGTKVSTARQALLAEQLATIAERAFPEHQQRLTWFALVGMESSYDGRARSSTGAVGLGQLIPRYAQDFGATCGLGEVDVRDIADDYVNLSLSACYFSQLIRDNEGSIEMALISYSSGPFSKDVKQHKQGLPISQGATTYVDKITAASH